MSTWNDTVNFIRTQLRPGVIDGTGVANILNSILAVIAQINAGEIDPQPSSLWQAGTIYAADVEPVLWRDQWLVSNIANNQGNVPINTSGVVHPRWRIIGSSAGSGIRLWSPLVYPNTLEIVFSDGSLYYLDRDIVGNGPFVSVNLADEINLEIWKPLTGSGGGGTTLPADIADALNNALNPAAANPFVTSEALQDALASIELPINRRLESGELIITSNTSGILNATWYDGSNTLRTITNATVTFPGLPPTGQFRWDIIELFDNGTFAVNSQSPTASEPIRPTQSPDTVVAAEVIWSDTQPQTVRPGNSNNIGDFPNTIFTTQTAPGNNGKFAKIWEGSLSVDQNYQIHISYGAPSSDLWPASGVKARSGMLVANFFCRGGRNITSVQLYTVDSNAETGDFVLVQLPGNRAALYHQATQFWMRLNFRVVFRNVAVRNQDFVNNGAYEALPSNVGQWDSQSIQDDRPGDFHPSTGTVLFDLVNGQPRKYGFTTAVTGNIVFGTAGAMEQVMVKIRHNSETAPTFSAPGGVTLVFEGGEYKVNQNNYIYAICHKNDSGVVTAISYTISQNQA